MGQVRDLEAEWTQQAIQRITTENTTLKQRVRQLTQDNRTLEERLQAARSNLRFRTAGSLTSKPSSPIHPSADDQRPRPRAATTSGAKRCDATRWRLTHVPLPEP